MATAAQIEANRRNAQMSTGPKTASGKARASLNSLKHGERAKVVVPVLPRKTPRSWTRRSASGSRTCDRTMPPSATWSSGRPGSPGRSTASSGARPPGWPCGCGRPSSRRTWRPSRQVCDLGRKLLYNAGPRILPVSGPPWDDNPAAFLCGLESTAEGCRWLLERWTVLGDMLEREAIWTLTDLYRSIRLQGKHPVDAINDPDLNLQIQAWEMMSPGAAIDFWERCYHQTPKVDPGFQGFMEWREIADKPADEAEAMGLIKRMIAGRVERLEEMISLHEEIAGEEAIELADAASFDPGPEAERLRRSQAAKSRELRQTLELFLKMQAARDKRKTLTAEGTEGTEGRERWRTNARTKPIWGAGWKGARRGKEKLRKKGSISRTTDGEERAAGLGTGRGMGAGRAGSADGPAKGGRFPAGRDPPRGEQQAVGKKGCDGEKKGASEANLEAKK